MIRLARLLALASALVTANVAQVGAEVVYFEDFEDQAHDLALAGGSGHTIGGGISSQSYGVEADGDGYDLEMRLTLLSPASDEGGTGSYVWPGARVNVPAAANGDFSISAELTVDEAFAGGAERGLSVGLVARCSYQFDPTHCTGFDALNTVTRYYRLSYAIVGEDSYHDTGAALWTGDLRLYEYGGDGQVDATVAGIAMPLGSPFVMTIEGTMTPGGLALVGRMNDGVAEAVVEGFDSTPHTGPGFGVRTGGSVVGYAGADTTGVLDVDVDDLTIAPEPGAPALALAAVATTLAQRARMLRPSTRRRARAHRAARNRR